MLEMEKNIRNYHVTAKQRMLREITVLKDTKLVSIAASSNIGHSTVCLTGM